MYIYLIHKANKSSVYSSNRKLSSDNTRTLLEVTNDKERVNFWAKKLNVDKITKLTASGKSN